MKIGIISINMYSKGLNFACPLHSYAFQQFLLANGIESTIINYKPIYFDNFDLRHPYDYYLPKYEQLLQKPIPTDAEKRVAHNKKLEYYKEKVDSWKPLYKEREVRYDKFQNFIDNNYIKTDYCYDSDTLEIMNPGFDCYICVTDVIWKNQPNVGFDRGFFLGSTYMENKWKIAYSASQGTYIAQNDLEKDLFFYYLKDIDALSVREESLKNYITENSSLNATQVLDPVLLNKPEFYDKILIKPQEEHFLLLYYVMNQVNDTVEQAIKYAQEHNLKIIEITDHPLKGGNLAKYPNVNYEFRFDIGVEEWLGYLRYADCIFTNSFHACCFSILFEKQFHVGFRQGDKVTNLLSMFGLLDRIFTPEPETPTFWYRVKKRLTRHTQKLIPALYNKTAIDYTKVRLILEEKREESSAFILNAIHSMENQTRPVQDYDTHKRALTYPLRYNSRFKNMPIISAYDETVGTLKKLESGSFEYQLKDQLYTNNGECHLLKNQFQLDGYIFRGWNIRLRIDNRWFWYRKDGTLVLKNEYSKEKHGALYLFQDEDTLPYIPVNRISSMVAEAIWKPAK